MAPSSGPLPFTVAVRGVSLARGDRPVLSGVDLTLTERSRIAVVGPNGVGKSTLLRIIAGRLAPEAGEVVASPPPTTIGLLDQELRIPPRIGTVAELIAERLGVTAATDALDDASAALADPELARAPGAADRYDQALADYLAIGAADFRPRLEEVADDLGLARRLLDADPRVLSGGEGERVGLAMVILSRFDLTLLDEPTNNLDLAGLDRLERWVDEHTGGLCVVSHDRAFLERAVTSVVEIDHHAHTARTFAGGWVAYREERARLAAQADRRYQDYMAERERLVDQVRTRRDWGERGARRIRTRPADGDRNRRSAELARAEKQVGKAKTAQRALDRLQAVAKPWEPWELRFTIGATERSADVVAALDGVVVDRGRFRLGPIDLEVRWTDRLAIVGPNGTGKSTLLDVVVGRLDPTAGSARLGSGVVIGELGQRRDAFSAPSATADGGPGPALVRVFQDQTGLAGDAARSVLAKFGLDTDAVLRPAATLSPGERTRARLAAFQAVGVNLLVLDEPTNHLDLEAIEQLESALDRFAGTLLLVSHDRRLVERVRLTRTVELPAPEAG
ncbi:MAG: ABC-F family ATP-binding cassette domain-containing protein [Actinomycetota bacterium]